MKNEKLKYILAASAAALVVASLIYSLFREDPGKSKSPDSSSELRSMQLVMNNGSAPDLPDGTDIEAAVNKLKRKRFIRDVIIEKNTVCAGEDFEVRVVMENPDGPESDLVCSLGDKFSNAAIFNYFQPGDQVIDIIVRDHEGNFDARSLPVSVIDCPEKAALFINANRSERMAEEIDFSIIGKRGIEPPCTYEWDFGDGTFLSGAEENVSHDYGKRPQDEFSSMFTVTVKATDKNGRKATSRTSVTLINTKYVSRRVGFAVVPIIYDTTPAFVDNAHSIRVKIKNIYDEPITFREATIQKKILSGGEVLEQETVRAGSLMKVTEVKSGEIADDVITIPPGFVPVPGQTVQITLTGTFPDNSSAKGVLYLFKE